MRPVRRARARRASRRGPASELPLPYRPFTNAMPSATRRTQRLEAPRIGGMLVASGLSALAFAGAPLLLAGGVVSENAYVLLSMVAIFVFTLALVRGAKDLEPG